MEGRLAFALLLAGFVAALAPGGARAQVPPPPELEPAPEPEGTPGRLVVPGGLTMMVGGGVFGFTDDEMFDFVDLGGMWEARVSWGSRSWIAVEAAYVGSAADPDGLGLDGDALLLGTRVEGTARVNFLELIPGAVRDPGLGLFGAAGAGWRRFDLLDAEDNRSNLRDEDRGGYVPVSGGLLYRAREKIFEIRATYRFSFGDDLIRAQGVGQDSWSVNASVGIEY